MAIRKKDLLLMNTEFLIEVVKVLREYLLLRKNGECF